MIISYRHRFIFFAVPKTGTHSLRQALRPYLADTDLEQVGLMAQRKFPFPELAEVRHGHLSVEQIQPCVGDEVFKGYFKFAFVRNPFDRFVSYCAFISRENSDFRDHPRAFMKFVIRDLKPVDHLLFVPQHTFLVDRDGELRMDFVGRVERLQADYEAICRRLSVPSAPLAMVNATEHRPYREYYDADLVAWVTDYYRADLEMFGYQFNEPEPG